MYRSLPRVASQITRAASWPRDLWGVSPEKVKGHSAIEKRRHVGFGVEVEKYNPALARVPLFFSWQVGPHRLRW